MLGFNYRMTECQAALGIVQLNSLETRFNHKENIVKHCTEFFSKSEFMTLSNANMSPNMLGTCIQLIYIRPERQSHRRTR